MIEIPSYTWSRENNDPDFTSEDALASDVNELIKLVEKLVEQNNLLEATLKNRGLL